MSRGNLPRLLSAATCVVMLVACSKSAPPAAVSAVEAQPDFSGWWSWDAPIGALPSPFVGAPFKPQLAQVYKVMEASYDTAVTPDPVALGARPGYCDLPTFAGFNGGFDSDVEFLVMPERITITNEVGMIRRVAMNRSLHAQMDLSRFGTSVGHWEGKTLVIETGGLRADNPVYFSPAQVGRDAHVTERISLTGPDTMEIALKMTAPEIFTQPFEKRLVYKRDHGHEYREYSACERSDRSVDPVTGRQRLEMTPPADLPSPPKD